MAFLNLGILGQTRDDVLATVIARSADANESAKRQANRRGINCHGMFLDDASAFQSSNARIDGWSREISALAKLGIGGARIFPEQA